MTVNNDRNYDEDFNEVDEMLEWYSDLLKAEHVGNVAIVKGRIHKQVAVTLAVHYSFIGATILAVYFFLSQNMWVLVPLIVVGALFGFYKAVLSAAMTIFRQEKNNVNKMVRTK